MLSQLFLYSWILLGHFTQSIEIHEMMTDEEYKDTFGGSRDNVPDYEVVEISHSINKRETGNNNRAGFYVFGEYVELNLQPVAHTKIPVWLSYGVIFKNGDHFSYKVSYEPVNPFIMADALNFYEDPNRLAAIVTETDEQGNLHFAGTVQGSFTIRPISSPLIREWYNNEIKPLIFGNSTASNYHIIIKDEKAHQHLVNTVKRSTRNEEPIKIFPRLLIFTHYKKEYKPDLEKRLYKLLIYLVAFWHSVNLRYQAIPDPSITLRIAGIVVGMNEEAAPYIVENRHKSGRGISDNGVHQGFSRWINSKLPMSRDSWDIAVLLTDKAMCSGSCKTTGIGGIAWVEAECYANDSYIYMAAIVYDNRVFSGIVTATHEIGHILGAHDDGDRGAESCAQDEKIMRSHSTESSNYVEWSSCSIEAISRHIKKTYPHCWMNIVKNNPDLIGTEIYEILPGHLMTPGDQCRKRGWDLPCEVDENTCGNLLCRVSGFPLGTLFGDLCFSIGEPLDGTDCGNGKQCKNARCVR